MKRFFILPLGILLCSLGFTQTDNNALDLRACYQKAINNYPLGERPRLLQQAKTIRVEQIDASSLPVIDWKAQATYQSETVKFPFEIPGMSPIDLPLFRAQTSLNASYTIYDGGIAEARKEMEESGLLADQQSVIVELDRLKERVNEYFFGILMLREKTSILEVSLDNLETKVSTLEAGFRHGAVLESEVDKLRVEILRLRSQIEETRSQKLGLISILGSLIGETLEEDVPLAVPELGDMDPAAALQRPELRLFELQKEKILANEKMITARWKPKVGAFLEAGVGYPNPLNFFDDAVSPFAIGGLQFQWSLFDWKQADRDRQLLTVQSQIIDNQRAVFEKNISMVEGKYLEDIRAVEQLLLRDREIAALQAKILLQVSSQLDNGVITSAEYIDQVNAEIQARLQLQTHRLQLEKIKANYLTHKGLL